MDTIDLHLDNDNELMFKVVVEGSRPADSVCRLMLERGDFSYAFSGKVSDEGEVSVVIPSLKKSLSEGTYKARLEVLVDDRIFMPLEFDANFKQSLKVTAEAVTRVQKATSKASAVMISSPKVENKKVIKESPPKETRAKSKSKIDVSKLSKSQMKQLVEMLEKRTRS
ncbi:MAG: hypothetical protein VYE05_04890 [Bacteroidota bacterium]|nr:hypothetical protein [Bacteroidota bacterium]